MSQKESLEETKQREFAIRCRKVRLWLAENPGATNTQLIKRFGKSVDFALGKMNGMGIIRSETCPGGEGGGNTAKWYVVPQ